MLLEGFRQSLCSKLYYGIKWYNTTVTAYEKFLILITIHVVLDKYLAYLVVIIYVEKLCKLQYYVICTFYYKTLFL